MNPQVTRPPLQPQAVWSKRVMATIVKSGTCFYLARAILMIPRQSQDSKATTEQDPSLGSSNGCLCLVYHLLATATALRGCREKQGSQEGTVPSLRPGRQAANPHD